MFLPVESLYAEAVRRRGLCERLQAKYRVMVAGPNTLAALLTSLRMGFRSVTLERRSGEVLKLLAAVRAEFARYEEAAANVRRRLRQTERRWRRWTSAPAPSRASCAASPRRTATAARTAKRTGMKARRRAEAVRTGFARAVLFRAPPRAFFLQLRRILMII